MSRGGLRIIDVRDPRKPRPVRLAPAPPNTWPLHLQAYDNLLLVINGVDIYNAALGIEKETYYSQPFAETFGGQERSFAAGMRVFDISKADEPHEIGFMPVQGFGLHRIWYTGGRYAHASAMLDGHTDATFIGIHLSAPTQPHAVGRCWRPRT